MSKSIDDSDRIEVVERIVAKAQPQQRNCAADEEPGDGAPWQQGSEPPDDPANAVVASVFNLEAAVRTCYGELDLFREMVGSLFEEAEPSLERMRSALARRDSMEIAQAVHRLRGSVVYLAAPSAAEATGCLEQIANSGDLVRAAFAIERVAHEIGRLMEALAPYRRIGSAQTE
jgi:HPt (histidine-containing phosphotransfer) domain-containing protein